MSLLDLALAPLVLAKHKAEALRLERRWRRLRAQGMHIGKGVNLPASTTIDESHCFLISIGDNCGFGEECHILAHDAQMDEYLNAARLGRVIIHPSCHIGAPRRFPRRSSPAQESGPPPQYRPARSLAQRQRRARTLRHAAAPAQSCISAKVQTEPPGGTLSLSCSRAIFQYSPPMPDRTVTYCRPPCV